MAQRRQTVTYIAAADASDHVIVLDEPAQAGSTLVLVCAAPAIQTIPAGGWTKRSSATSLSTYEVTTFDMVAAGGETSVTVHLSGPRSMAATLIEFTGLGAFMAGGVANGSGASVGLATVSAPAASVRIGMVAAATTATTVQGWSDSAYPVMAHPMISATTEDLFAAVAILDAPAGDLALSTRLSGAGNWQTIHAAYADPSGVPSYSWPNRIVKENAFVGTPSSEWQVTAAGDLAEIAGFATDISVVPGAAIDFKVDSGGLAFNVNLYRVGYYSGLGARKVGSITGTPVVQPTPDVQPLGGTDAGNWSVNASWTVPASAVPGVYVAKFIRSDNKAAQTLFVVRDPAGAANRVVVKTSDTTWHAYNGFGPGAGRRDGKDLYGEAEVFNASLRARAVSYNRPWVNRQGRPHTSFWLQEYNLVNWLEQAGYDLTYVAAVDCDRTPDLLLGQQAIISSGHDEYWSAGMRDAFQAARDSGVHLVFLSGNHVFWRVRWTDGYRTMVCYKDSLDGANSDPVEWTGTWRDTRAINPDRRSESSLTGTWFVCNGLVDNTMTVSDAYAASPLWRHTSVAELASGQSNSYPHLLGFEWQTVRDDAISQMPHPYVTMSDTTIDITGFKSSDDGDVYTLSGPATHNLCLYRASSGALVFSSGTIRWSWGLTEAGGSPVDAVSADIQQATINILADLGATAATLPSGLEQPVPVSAADYGLVAPIPEFVGWGMAV